MTLFKKKHTSSAQDRVLAEFKSGPKEIVDAFESLNNPKSRGRKFWRSMKIYHNLIEIQQGCIFEVNRRVASVTLMFC